ncbi:golgin subfamily A member 4 [Hyposmocoma kahamanoa]|uniref:golgin subfamily A member 4 n=1 Tax=Hyposmocoma kahamanoa TaxID=1477025 RepID=UPI000E6D79F6|nr:golgin subfamily A member 4 [Hyposmocoma kahamanoa]
MFKKLKDKLAEEVKSSPQRIQQFAQAAQAAVTSASSSISDITNNDLFSIGDSDSQQGRPDKVQPSPSKEQDTFREVSLIQPSSSIQDLPTSTESMSFTSQDLMETPRQRRLSNSSFASDVSFRLPSYESPSMYHLQSDMEVSASEAEERGFSSGMVNLERVTKDQIYAAYRRTQDRYTKYRTQYADLARHYKLLERENAKARSVLVETQDKALRRISELREQCSLEQSAKAHLEKALRIEIEERNMKIDTLNTKIKLLQENNVGHDVNIENGNQNEVNDAPLINLSVDNENNHTNNDACTSEIAALNTKIDKLEILVNKYKESLKSTKEKNSQITTELQLVTSELASKNKEIDQLQITIKQLDETRQKVLELNDLNEELQNKVNAYDFNKTKQMSTLEIDLHKAQEEITELQQKIEIFTKREEEYAISLAENKLRIHKELESKEAEIKSLKDSLSGAKTEIQSLNIVVSDYKNSIAQLEEEKLKLNNDINELSSTKMKITELESQLQTLTQKCQLLENSKSKADEEYKCLQLQLKQETAEKLAMVDRNTYLEDRNSQLSEENVKKSQQINNLDNELQILKKERISEEDSTNEKLEMVDEIEKWKNKCSDLEYEIQEEREELGKLQSEIEKLLSNHELIQKLNTELNTATNNLKTENKILQKDSLHEKLKKMEKNLTYIEKLENNVRDLNQENIALKNQCETIANNVKSLQCELSDVRKSHAEIEVEKDRLCFVIEELERNERINKPNDKDTQTNINIEQEPIQELVEVRALEELHSDQTRHKYDDELPKKYDSLLVEHNSLKEENRRLQSDVSGLQTYLAQISKENSILNDKMRELIAFDEGSTNKGLSDLKNEKMDDLIRENMLLIEENLELKDQLTSQNDYKPAGSQPNNAMKASEFMDWKEKYENLQDTNKMLQKRLKDVEHMNKSVNNNLQQVQDNNDKLKLSNEKLERRLDEALVSLRHLHSLQENTELEYLRNILYEYLTGSGTHSVTLAKVLAAVVKFDDAQTRQVLQKEKERQGFLRQLGII